MAVRRERIWTWIRVAVCVPVIIGLILLIVVSALSMAVEESRPFASGRARDMSDATSVVVRRHRLIGERAAAPRFGSASPQVLESLRIQLG